MSNNLWIGDVFLRINPMWGLFIAFESCTYIEATAVTQEGNIWNYIRVGQVVVEPDAWVAPP